MTDPTTTEQARAVDDRHVARWAAEHPLSAEQVDCVIAVMLKILDGKCKMPEDEKAVMRSLYQAVRIRPPCRLEHDLHRFIAALPGRPDTRTREAIYERRVLAETIISRPVMKAFKAMIRKTGLFDSLRVITPLKLSGLRQGSASRGE